MTYKVKPQGKKYIVETPEGRIANDHEHTTREQAERHCLILNAYFPDKGLTVTVN